MKKIFLSLAIALCVVNLTIAQKDTIVNPQENSDNFENLVAPVETVNASDKEKIKKKFAISGSVDAYFRANLNGSNNPEDNSTLAPATSFANLPGFSLGMANVIGEFSSGKVGAVADLVFGPRGADAVFGSQQEVSTPDGTTIVSGNSTIVNQLYAYWNVSDKVTLTIGNFNTFLGYEVISPTGNFNYSSTYMFSYGPFSHTGIKADFDLGNGFSLMTAIMNPTDATEFNPSGEYTGGLQIGYGFDQGSFYLNGILSDDFYQLDLTGGIDVSEKLYLGINSTYAKDNFYGIALYAQQALTENLKAGFRGEYFSNEGIFGNTVDNFVDLTLSLNYKVGDLTIIPEVRMDLASEDIYNLRTQDNPDLSNNLSSFVLAAVYQF